jgi:archaemetzincin
MSRFTLLAFLWCLNGLYSCQSPNPDKPKAKTQVRLEKKRICVCIQPYGGVDTLYVKAAAKALAIQYQVDTKILALQKLPPSASNQNIPALKIYQLPLRYRADTLLRVLARQKRKECDYMLGLTNQDITCTNRDKNGKIQEPTWMHVDWGIFGLGFRPGVSCVVSTYRLSFYTQDKKLIMSRVNKTVTHEIGHNFGLDHCPTPHCNMNAAPPVNALLATDLGSEKVCDKCRKKLNGR